MTTAICLMPTYGRRASLLNNSLACFHAQTYQDKKLLIYDDLGTLSKVQIDSLVSKDVYVVATPARCSSVGSKYDDMLLFIGDTPYSYAVVWDDDDVYLPDHITNHVKCLEAGNKWSKPSQIISAYFNPPKLEPSNGRFHGSIALWKDNLKHFQRMYGSAWIDTTRATFDQEFLQRCQEESPPGNTNEYGPPQYIYRWQTTQAGHCSGLMGSPTWYQDYKPDSTEPITYLTPQFDDDTLRLYRMFGYLV